MKQELGDGRAVSQISAISGLGKHLEMSKEPIWIWKLGFKDQQQPKESTE